MSKCQCGGKYITLSEAIDRVRCSFLPTINQATSASDMKWDELFIRLPSLRRLLTSWYEYSGGCLIPRHIAPTAEEVYCSLLQLNDKSTGIPGLENAYRNLLHMQRLRTLR